MQHRLLGRALAISGEPVTVQMSSRWRIGTVLAAAAAVALAATLAVLSPWGGGESGSPLIADAGPRFAMLTHTGDVAWSADTNVPRLDGARFGRGVVAFDSGFVRIAFDNGASVALQGPARFELIDADHARLHHGCLTAHAPQLEDGFTIDTPTMNVVDRGTAFGISVSPAGDTDVAVFEGEVDVAVAGKGGEKREWMRLKAGAAVRALAGRMRIDSVTFDGDVFTEVWPVASGVVRTTGVVRFIEPGPPPIPHRYEDTNHIVVFPERDGATLAADTPVNIDTPGIYYAPFDGMYTLPAGVQIRSYLLQFNPVGRVDSRQTLVGAVTFDQPILGIIVTDEYLHASDDALGAEGTRYSLGGRGLEGRDAVALSDDRHTLLLDWSAAIATDQIRVLVASPRVTEGAR
jgi:hypothetical protein